jgi:hypothetical protein
MASQSKSGTKEGVASTASAIAVLTGQAREIAAVAEFAAIRAKTVHSRILANSATSDEMLVRASVARRESMPARVEVAGDVQRRA